MEELNVFTTILSEGEDYATYTARELHPEDAEYLEKMNHYHASCVVDDDTNKKIESLSGSIMLLVVAERWCPDSIINLPALAIMEARNPCIQMRIINRTGHEHILDDLDPNNRTLLPTVLVYKEKVLMGMFSERPKVVVKAEHSDDQVRKIAVMKAYRDGQYMVETICDILELLKV